MISTRQRRLCIAPTARFHLLPNRCAPFAPFERRPSLYRHSLLSVLQLSALAHPANRIFPIPGVSLSPQPTHGRRRVHVRTHTRNTHTHANNGKIYRYVCYIQIRMLFYERFKTIYNMCAGNTYAHTRTHSPTRTHARGFRPHIHTHIQKARAHRPSRTCVADLQVFGEHIVYCVEHDFVLKKMFILH